MSSIPPSSKPNESIINDSASFVIAVAVLFSFTLCCACFLTRYLSKRESRRAAQSSSSSSSQQQQQTVDRSERQRQLELPNSSRHARVLAILFPTSRATPTARTTTTTTVVAIPMEKNSKDDGFDDQLNHLMYDSEKGRYCWKTNVHVDATTCSICIDSFGTYCSCLVTLCITMRCVASSGGIVISLTHRAVPLRCVAWCGVVCAH